MDKCFTKLLSRVREMPRAPVPLSMLPVHDHVSWPLTRMQEMPRSPVSFSLLPVSDHVSWPECNKCRVLLSLSVTGICIWYVSCPECEKCRVLLPLSVTCIWPCVLTRVREMPRAPVPLWPAAVAPSHCPALLSAERMHPKQYKYRVVTLSVLDRLLEVYKVKPQFFEFMFVFYGFGSRMKFEYGSRLFLNPAWSF